MDRLRIRTPEGIVFALPLAGPVSRFLAWLTDLACIGAAQSVLGICFALIGLLNRDVAAAFSILSYFALSVLYPMLAEWFWRGQTVGKRLLGLRVVDEQGLRLQFSQVALRNIFRGVDLLPAFYLVGGAAMMFTRRAQRLGDFAANTVVIRARRFPEPDLDQVLPRPYNSLREHPHLEARLRQRITPEQADVALRALLRRDGLEPRARLELFRDLAASFRSMVEFPPEAAENLTDEQYVRNAVDIAFRPRNRASRTESQGTGTVA